MLKEMAAPLQTQVSFGCASAFLVLPWPGQLAFMALGSLDIIL